MLANHNTFNNEYSLATNTFNNEYLLANDTFNNEYLLATNKLLGSNMFNKELATNTFDNEYLLASMWWDRLPGVNGNPPSLLDPEQNWDLYSYIEQIEHIIFPSYFALHVYILRVLISVVQFKQI